MGTRTLKQKGANFIENHGEIWKFIKWSLFTGLGASGTELIVHMVLLNFVFVALHDISVTNPFLLYIKISDLGYMYSYFISAVIGYSIAFVLNRKLTFKADINPLLSAFLAIILMIFNIFAATWIGSTLSGIVLSYQWGSMGDAVIKVLTMLIPSVWVYPANRFVIHRKKKVVPSET
jgi:putative flippase GtrA